MDFKERLKMRLTVAVIIGLIGVSLILTGYFMNKDMASAFGTMFFIIGIARIVQYIRITRNEEVLHQKEVQEIDERNVMLWTKARSLAFSVFIILAGIAVPVLYIFNMEFLAQIIAYGICIYIIIYWICYLIIRHKY